MKYGMVIRAQWPQSHGCPGVWLYCLFYPQHQFGTACFELAVLSLKESCHPACLSSMCVLQNHLLFISAHIKRSEQTNGQR